MELRLRRIPVKFLWPFVAGLSVTLTAFVLVATIVSAPRVVPVLVAAESIAQGELVTSERLVLKQLPLGSVSEMYLQSLPENLTANRSFETGELITKSALTDQTDTKTPVRINGLPQLSKSISVGDVVDVWVTTSSQIVAVTPQPVVFGAIVIAIENSTTLSQPTANVELRIPVDYLESFLSALEPPNRISLILNETLRDLD
jgi:hypothetical protein